MANGDDKLFKDGKRAFVSGPTICVMVDKLYRYYHILDKLY